jgi:hypothetical protein
MIQAQQDLVGPANLVGGQIAIAVRVKGRHREGTRRRVGAMTTLDRHQRIAATGNFGTELAIRRKLMSPGDHRQGQHGSKP